MILLPTFADELTRWYWFRFWFCCCHSRFCTFASLRKHFTERWSFFVPNYGVVGFINQSNHWLHYDSPLWFVLWWWNFHFRYFLDWILDFYFPFMSTLFGCYNVRINHSLSWMWSLFFFLLSSLQVFRNLNHTILVYLAICCCWCSNKMP